MSLESRITKHCKKRMKERNISLQMVEAVAYCGERFVDSDNSGYPGIRYSLNENSYKKYPFLDENWKGLSLFSNANGTIKTVYKDEKKYFKTLDKG